MISTNPSSCQGRYVGYSQEIDKVFFENLTKVKSFREEKISELLKEIEAKNTSFNLACEKGIGTATKQISDEISEKLNDFSKDNFSDLRRDFALSVISSVLRNSKHLS